LEYYKDSRGQGFEDSSELITPLKNFKSETQMLLSGDLGYIEDAILKGIKDEIHEVERVLKALIKSLENKPLNPRILYYFLPTSWEKNQKN